MLKFLKYVKYLKVADFKSLKDDQVFYTPV